MYERRQMTKLERQQIRAVAAAGHEMALRRALERLAADFDRWREGNLGSFDLEERIHKFHNGEAREIYNWFVTGRSSSLPGEAAYSMAAGWVKEEDVPAEAMSYLAPLTALYRAELKEDQEDAQEEDG